MGKILLEGMEFFAYHGCYREERIIGTKFTVDLSLEADTSAAEKSDQLQDTISYVEIYGIVKKEMGDKSHLLEHVAHRIIESLRSGFPHITAITLKISKLNPPVGGKVQHAGFETSWRK